MVAEGTPSSSADGTEEIFGPKKEPGGVTVVEAVIVSRKARHTVIDSGVTSSEIAVNEVALEAHFVDSLGQRVLGAVVQCN